MLKKVLVTGASEGIGRAIAVRMASEGYKVTGVARNAEKLEELRAFLGDGHVMVAADLASGEGLAMVQSLIRDSGFDVLVNNAGVGASGYFSELPADRHHYVMRLNCDALVALSHSFLEQARPGCALVNVSSVLAYIPMPGLGVYAATKAFVTSFSESLWYEQRKRGVFVMALHPGLTATDFQVHAGGQRRNKHDIAAQSPEAVADAFWEGLKARRSPLAVSGLRNTLAVELTRLLPRRALLELAGRFK